MKGWEEKHILDNLARLIQITECNVILLASLNQIFSQQDIAVVKSHRTPYDKADALYRTAIQKVDGYDKLALALHNSKQTGALEIILKGYRKNNKKVPVGLDAGDFGIGDKITFEWQGNMATLEELLGPDTPTETIQKIYDELNKHDHPRTIKLLNPKLIPEIPKYYIQRTLSYVPLFDLSENIFTSKFTTAHVFVFMNADKNEIVRITNYREPIDGSWSQLRNVTVRFIIQESPDHFDRICKVTSKPTHLIQRDDGRYLWVKSNSGTDVVQRFFKTSRMPINENEMVSNITSDSCSVCISDTPGMGKTLLLQNLAALVSRDINNMVLFIVLQELIQKIQPQKFTSAIDAIAEYSSNDKVTQSVMIEMLKNQFRKVYLFFDGFDEVNQEKQEETVALIKQLNKLKNIKIIVTTRPHFGGRLEAIFNQISFHILPFTESNQTEFLADYWVNHAKFAAHKSDILVQFAKLCLRALEKVMTDKEKSFAGIPLQCMMLGEVYAEDARSAGCSKTLMDSIVSPLSFFEMYQKLVLLKLKRVTDLHSQKKYLNAHILHAVALLFPEWKKVFTPLLEQNSGEVDVNILYSIGLVEQSPDGIARFIHRTFAEYLLAEFIADNLGKNLDCVIFLFQEIHGHMGVTIEIDDEVGSVLPRELRHPVIGYFIEMHLKDHAKDQPIDSLSISLFTKFLTKLSNEDVCIAMVACCQNDLEYTFDYVTKILGARFITKGLKNQFFKPLPLIVAINSNNMTLLKKVLEFTKSKLNVDLYFHEISVTEEGYTFGFNSLHAAARFGKYNIFAWLVEQYKKLDNQWRRKPYLLHMCLLGSEEDTDPVVEEKLLIIDLLVATHREWINEWDPKHCTPLLQGNVHLHLLKRLVHHGADINDKSRACGTLLHRPRNSSSYKELVKWAFSSGFLLINETNEGKLSPLMYAFQNIGGVDVEVLELFHGKRVDWNAQDKYGDSVLFYALEYSEDVNVINKLMEYGANVNHKSNIYETAAHIVLKNENFNSEEIIKVLKLLETNGFNRWNKKDSKSQTPLELAQKMKKMDDDLAMFFNKRIHLH